MTFLCKRGALSLFPTCQQRHCQRLKRNVPRRVTRCRMHSAFCVIHAWSCEYTRGIARELLLRTKRKASRSLDGLKGIDAFGVIRQAFFCCNLPFLVVISSLFAQREHRTSEGDRNGCTKKSLYSLFKSQASSITELCHIEAEFQKARETVITFALRR